MTILPPSNKALFFSSVNPDVLLSSGFPKRPVGLKYRSSLGCGELKAVANGLHVATQRLASALVRGTLLPQSASGRRRFRRAIRP